MALPPSPMFTVTPDRPQRVDLSSYTIRLANVAQEIEHWRASYVHWGRGKDWAVGHHCSPQFLYEADEALDIQGGPRKV